MLHRRRRHRGTLSAVRSGRERATMVIDAECKVVDPYSEERLVWKEVG